MTDREKIQFLVDRLFAGKRGPAMIWNPIVSADDAFMVVEAMRPRFRFALEAISIETVDGYQVTFYAYSPSRKPAKWFWESGKVGKAIVNAAIAALEAK